MRNFAHRGLSVLGLAALLLVATAIPVLAQAQTGELRSYADVAAKTMPAVVNISTDKMVENNPHSPFMDDPMFRRFFNMPDDDTHNHLDQTRHGRT